MKETRAAQLPRKKAALVNLNLSSLLCRPPSSLFVGHCKQLACLNAFPITHPLPPPCLRRMLSSSVAFRRRKLCRDRGQKVAVDDGVNLRR